MSYKAMAFNSLEDLNRYFEVHVDDVPISITAGFVANSVCVLLEVPSVPVTAKSG